MRGNAGFFGATSYSCIFSEGLGNLEAASAGLEAPQTLDMTVSEERIARGCQVLAFLKDKPMINRFVSRWYEICEGAGGVCLELIMKEWLMKLGIHHGEVLTSQEPEKIRRLCELIWRNTQTPLVFSRKTTALEWAHLSTGQNLRWEVIGLIAAVVGLCASCLDPSDRFLSYHKVTRYSISKKMREISRTCLSFCRDCEAIDDMFIWLLLEDEWLTSAIKGDRNYATYRASGETNNAVLTMGLHQGVKASDNIPFFLAQLRKRAFMEAYSVEVSMATFLGRPPRLSHRYCKIDPPLDLTDHQLILEGPELDAALAGLDKNGYNLAGRLNRITCMRTYLGLAPRREDILDLALGDYTPEEILQRAAVIQRKSEEHWASLPPFMARTRDSAFDFSKTKPLETLYSSAVRQGSRANELLLQRVLMRRAGASPEKLVGAARDILRDILQITQRHDIASMFRMDFTALLVAHGLRSGAIIAVELLKQEQQQLLSSAHHQHNHGNPPPLLPRSQTIQDLSVFAARLGAVDPRDGAFGMCDQGRKVITRILDKILTPCPPAAAAPSLPPPALRHHAQAPQYQHHQGLGQMDLDGPADRAAQEAGLAVPEMAGGGLADFGIAIEAPLSLGHDTDFMQWLENMDWERADTWTGF